MKLDAKIEAILFVKGEPVKIKTLAKFLEVEEKEVKEAIETLSKHLIDRGLQVVVNDDEVMLGTAAVLGPMIEKIQKEELDQELSKAALETLAIILYAHPEGATRAKIDWLRGVNSSFILRTLSIRGLISKEINPIDKRTFIYKPTIDLLSYLGVSKIEDLPDFVAIREKLAERLASEGQDEE